MAASTFNNSEVKVRLIFEKVYYIMTD